MRFRAFAILFATLSFCVAPAWSADVQKGIAAYSIGNYEGAIAEWQPLAENGNAEGQFWLATLYSNGMGVPQSDEIALKWFRLAADQEHAGAQYNIGLMHANGWGLDMSVEEAKRWYQRAAENGSPEAQFSLGDMYDGGWGMERDYVQAYIWLSLAAAQDHSEATHRIKEIREKISADELTAAEQGVQTWLDKLEAKQAKKDTAYAYSTTD